MVALYNQYCEILPFIDDDTDCKVSPTVVSSNDQFSNKYPAASALTDGIDDVSPQGSELANYWAGQPLQRSGYDVDLGCYVVIKEVHFRNSHDGKHYN